MLCGMGESHETSCAACTTTPSTSSGRCPVCGRQRDAAPSPRGESVMPQIVVLGIAIVGACGWLGWRYWDTWRQDPEMLGICVVCGFIGLVAGSVKLFEWKRRAGEVRDFLD
jgi:hypothetical protein